jgi:TatA/E family protein of Tat protein translocase
MNIGPTELIVILIIALIVFGPRKLPDLGKSLGQAMAQFRRASDDFKRSWEQEVEVEKMRLSEIKQEIETPPVSYSSSPYDPEAAAAETAGEGRGEESGPEPEPAASTVARGGEPARTEHWI